MKLVFFGSGTFALQSLKALLQGPFAPALVVSQPPRRRRRGAAPEPTPVSAAAGTAGLAVFTPEKVNAPESLERLRADGDALFVVAEYGALLSAELLQIPAPCTINVHASLLPRHRGASPVAAAILAGDTETGVTIQRTVLELDAGPILAARTLAIGPEEDAGALTARLARVGAELLLEVVQAFADGTAPPEREQDADDATYAPRLKRDAGVLDWSESAAALALRVRAMTPRPGARVTLLRDPPLPVRVLRSRAAEGEAEPGTLARLDGDSLWVGTGDGLLEVQEVVPAGRRPMSGRAFANGFHLQPGALFATAAEA